MEEIQSQTKWYFKPTAVIVALLCVGPLALPVLWLSPAFKRIYKIIITVLVIILTVGLFKASVELYNILLREIQNLRDVLN